MIDPAQNIVNFFSRLLEPIRIGNSLKKVDVTLQQRENSNNALWFHGDGPSDLFLWENGHHTVKSWYLEYGQKYVKWHKDDGLETGTLLPESKPSLTAPWEKKRKKDPTFDAKVRQFALDIFMVLNFDKSEAVIATLKNG